MEHKHTQGPWEAGNAYAEDKNLYCAMVFAPAKTGKMHIPRTAEALGLCEEEAAANAALIAAAPDLLAALEAMLDRYASTLSGQRDPNEPSQAREAIAKAKG